MTPLLLALAILAQPQTGRGTSIAAAVDPALDTVCAIPASAPETDRRARAEAAGFAFRGDFSEREATDGSIAVRNGPDGCTLEMMVDGGSVAAVEAVVGSWAFIHGLSRASDETVDGVGRHERWSPGRGRLGWSATPSHITEEPALVHVTWRPQG